MRINALAESDFSSDYPEEPFSKRVPADKIKH
jgi:hypothetical protein